MVVEMINNSDDTRNLTLESCPLGVLYEAFRRYDDVTALYVTSLGDGARYVEYVEVEFKVSGGVLDAAEGKPERETLPYDIHRMFKDDYQRGYREGYNHGNE